MHLLYIPSFIYFSQTFECLLCVQYCTSSKARVIKIDWTLISLSWHSCGGRKGNKWINMNIEQVSKQKIVKA